MARQSPHLETERCEPLQPRHYLDLADVLASPSLASPPIDQAAFRSAVSRAYYAAFLATRLVVNRHGAYFGPARGLDLPADEPGIDRHKKFWAGLGCKLKRVGEIGNDLRIWRNHADYDLGDGPRGGWNRGARECVLRANILFRELDKAEEAARVAEQQKRVADQKRQDRIARYSTMYDTAHSMPELPKLLEKKSADSCDGGA